MADSRLCKLSLQLIFVPLSRSTTIALSFLELAEEDCFGHAYVFNPCDVASSPAQLHLKQDGSYAGQACSPEVFFARLVVLPFDAMDGAQATLVKPLQYPELLLVENPGLCTCLLYTSPSPRDLGQSRMPSSA